MEFVKSFQAFKVVNTYIIKVYNLHPDGDTIPFQIDTGAGFTFLGLNSFCDPENSAEYNLLKKIVEEEILKGKFEQFKKTALTATKEEIEMYPCRYKGISVFGAKTSTLYFYIYLGDIGMALLGFDYIDDCSYHHNIGGEFVVNAVADNVGRRFYPDKVIEFNSIIDRFCRERNGA